MSTVPGVLTDDALRSVTRTLEAITGLPYVPRERRISERSVWCVWDADVHVRYALSIESVGLGAWHVSMAVQRGPEAVESRLDTAMDDLQVRRLLADPHLVVGIMLGQRRWTG